MGGPAARKASTGVTKLRKHLSFSNVIACTALFVALSASAYAATKLGPGQVKAVNIANQAVINSKLKREAVTSGKIKKGGVTRANMGAGAVTTAALDSGAVTGKKIGKKAVSPRTLASEAVTAEKLANESVSAAKLSASFYAQLVRNVTYVSASSASNSEANKAVSANCTAPKTGDSRGRRPPRRRTRRGRGDRVLPALQRHLAHRLGGHRPRDRWRPAGVTGRLWPSQSAQNCSPGPHISL